MRGRCFRAKHLGADAAGSRDGGGANSRLWRRWVSQIGSLVLTGRTYPRFVERVWIVYRGNDDAEILGVFDNQDEATRYAQTLAETHYEGERIWTGGYAVPYRITDDVPR